MKADLARPSRAGLTVSIMLKGVLFTMAFVCAMATSSYALLALSVEALDDLLVDAQRRSARLEGQFSAAFNMRRGSLLFLVPTFGTLWMLMRRQITILPTSPETMCVVGLVALAIHFVCTTLIPSISHERVIGRSAGHGLAADVIVILAGLTTAFLWQTGWPDFIGGILVAAVGIGAHYERTKEHP